MEYIWIGLAFVFGLVVRQTGLPSLIGYLGAGFMITVLADNQVITLPEQHKDILEHIAHYGILLLLFMVGLKLNVKKVVKSEVIGTGVIHFGISAAIFTPIIMFCFNIEFATSVLLAIALSFSSTVLAAKVLEGKSELKAFHGRVAIGVLIIQDLVALTVMAISSGTLPSVWAFGLLALPLLRPLFYWMLDKSGHDEMLILCGLVLGVIVGGAGFHAVGLSGELGALAIGALVANHPKAAELSEKLWGLKEIFLTLFFLTIGLNGLPNWEAVEFAVLMTALLPLQGLIFFALLVAFKLKARSAFLASTSLTNFSEFGLIVAAAIMPEYTVTIALCVAFSFILSAPLNRFAHPLFDKWESFLTRFERKCHHPDEEPVSLGNATILIMGMGRVGRSAFKAIRRLPDAPIVLGLDSDQDKINALQEKGYNAKYADAEHGNFWGSLDFTKLESCILAMNCAEACKIAATKLRENGFEGTIIAHARHRDEAQAIKAAGADETYLTYEEAGEGLAGHVVKGVVPKRITRNTNIACYDDYCKEHPSNASEEPVLV